MNLLVRQPGWVTLAVALFFVLCHAGRVQATSLPIPLPACGAGTPAAGSNAVVARPIGGQVRHIDQAEITFHGSTTVDGGVQVDGRGGNLVFRKKSLPDGRFTLDLEAPGDKVAIAITEHAVTITRNKRRITVSLDAGTDKALDAARVLLGDSSAVRLARVAAAAVLEAEDDSAPSTALLVGDALVGMLTGDAGAPGRVARHLSRHARTGVRRVATNDCYADWERRTLRASYEWESCARAFSVWNPARNLCAFRWMLQVESYWFSFISCTGFSAF